METRNITATEEILNLVLRIQDIDRSMSALKAEKKRHVERIKEFLGGKPGAAAKIGRYTLASWKPRRSFSTALFREDYPEMYEEYMVESAAGSFSITDADLSKLRN